MKDCEADLLEQRILFLRNKWIEPLGLGAWRIALHFYRDSGEYQEEIKTGIYAGATCDAQWQYQRAHIHFNLFRLKPLTAREIEETVVHELCHLVLAEMQMCMDAIDDHHVEHAATALMQAFLWVRDAGIAESTTEKEVHDGEMQV